MTNLDSLKTFQDTIFHKIIADGEKFLGSSAKAISTWLIVITKGAILSNYSNELKISTLYLIKFNVVIISCLENNPINF